MAFNIFYNKDALKDLENIKNKIPNDCVVILKKIENILTANPFPFGQTIKKLKNIQPTLYRLRVNASMSYRILFFFHKLTSYNYFMLYEKILTELEKNNIKYMVIGGLAVNLYGFPRVTQDLDLMVSFEKENMEM